jgi:hypothetical protein
LLTDQDIRAMRSADARRRVLLDDDELRIRGVVTAERKFDPLQKRDDHGRWSKLGAALHAIAEAAKAAVVGHEVFGGQEGHSKSHGIVAAHPGGDFTLALHDKDAGTREVMTIPDDDAREELQEAFAEVRTARRCMRTSMTTLRSKRCRCPTTT